MSDEMTTPEPSESARELAKSAILESYSWDHQNGSSFQRLDRDVLEDEVTKAISTATASARRDALTELENTLPKIVLPYPDGYARAYEDGVKAACAAWRQHIQTLIAP